MLTVREVPETVYRTLRERAAANRRSLQQEVRQVLETDAARRRFDFEGLLRFRERFRGRFQPGESLRILRELRDGG